jgi:hypothetical protein
MPEATTNGNGGGFLDYFRTAGDVFGSVYGSINPRQQPQAPRAAGQPQPQNNLLMYGLIGGGVLLLLIVILSISRR